MPRTKATRQLRKRFAIFGRKGDTEILCGNSTFAARESAEKKLAVYEKIFGVRGYTLEIKPF